MPVPWRAGEGTALRTQAKAPASYRLVPMNGLLSALYASEGFRSETRAVVSSESGETARTQTELPGSRPQDYSVGAILLL